MIIDKSVKIKLTCRNITYYKNKLNNTEINVNDYIELKISDIQEGSTIKVNTSCDKCGAEKIMEYRTYNNNIKNGDVYYCNKCKHIKSKKTKLEIYGDENYNNKEKNVKTCLEKYGVTHYNKLETYKSKIRKTKLDAHGDENYNNMEKNKITKLEKYGDENYNNVEKNKKTCLEKYGEDSVFKVDFFAFGVG